MARPKISLAVAALSVLIGCADDASPPADSGAPDTGLIDASAEDAIVGVTPDAPALPVLTPCPTGWTSVDPGDGSPVTCDPFPAPPAESCGPGEAQFTGEAGCTAVGPECPADGWPTALPTDRPVLYVRADAAAGGDGTIAAPFTTIHDAIAIAATGSVIAVAPGRYVGTHSVANLDLSIRGACLDAVIESESLFTAVELIDTTSDLRNLTIVGSEYGLRVWNSTVDLVSVEVRLRPELPLGAGVLLHNGTLTGESVVVRGPMNEGVRARSASTLELQRAVIAGEMRIGVVVSDSIFRGDEVVIRGFVSGAAVGEAGKGVFVFGTSELTLTRSAIVDAIGHPVLATDDFDLTLRDCLVRGPPVGVAARAGAIAAVGPGSLSLDRVSISQLRNNGIVAAVGAHLEATDVVVVETNAPVDSPVGYGIELGAAATASMQRVFIDRSTAVGLLVDGQDTVIDATDLTIVRTRAGGGGTFGRAIQVQRGGVLTLNRVELRDNREVAISVARLPSSLTATNLRIVDTRQRQCAEDGSECAAAGIGVGAYEGGAVSVDRFLVAGSFLAGVQIATDGSLDLANGIVERNPVGANIQVPGYDVTRLTTNVLYRDNGVNLDSAELVVPAPDIPGR
ncbi:MAG: hypothetical protein JRH11_09655 [Deltaproteobacteria bacterium]|nr:hypothetical protein [Deltaproteobacteria bacterium]